MASRDVAGLVVARVGRVVFTGDPLLPWAVLDGAGAPVEPVAEFMRDLLACGSSPASCRSYGFDLLRWFRFLAVVDVEWQRAQRGEVRDFVSWLRVCHNPARDRHRPDAPAPGAVNPRTGKTSLRVGYAPRPSRCGVQPSCAAPRGPCGRFARTLPPASSPHHGGGRQAVAACAHHRRTPTEGQRYGLPGLVESQAAGEGIVLIPRTALARIASSSAMSGRLVVRRAGSGGPQDRLAEEWAEAFPRRVRAPSPRPVRSPQCCASTTSDSSSE